MEGSPGGSDRLPVEPGPGPPPPQPAVVVEDTGPEECDGTWESCCNGDGMVDQCCCPDGMACNFGWYNDCGDGTCVNMDQECKASE